jgi:hypothetical protein
LQEAPKYGKEYFFSNVMLKVLRVPVMFIDPSQFSETENAASFIVMIYEKKCIKRKPANKDKELEELKLHKQLKRHNKQRYLMDRLAHREAKMRRFVNFFEMTFDIKKINPFTQFIKQNEFDLLKEKVHHKMQEFFTKPLKDKG